MYINPMCLSFIYKTYCQSIFTYGLELSTIPRTICKQIDIRQNILIKASLGLSKYSLSRPILNALGISSINEIYFKFKILFIQQLKMNCLAYAIFNRLTIDYTGTSKPKLSFLKQIEECRNFLKQEVLTTNKKELLIKLSEKFQCPNEGLIDSVRYLLSNYEMGENRYLLGRLVWVDFYS